MVINTNILMRGKHRESFYGFMMVWIYNLYLKYKSRNCFNEREVRCCLSNDDNQIYIKMAIACWKDTNETTSLVIQTSLIRRINYVFFRIYKKKIDTVIDFFILVKVPSEFTWSFVISTRGEYRKSLISFNYLFI